MLSYLIGLNLNDSGLIRLNYIQSHLISLNVYENLVKVEDIN